MRTGDIAAFRSTIAGAPDDFRARQIEWFSRMRDLPLRRYSLRLRADTYTDLAPALRGRPGGDEVRVVPVTEHVALGRYDRKPSAEQLILTVVRRGAGWSIVEDSDLADIGLFSSRNVWDFAAVDLLQRPDALVLHHDDRATAERIADETTQAAARVRDGWPLGWRGDVIVVIPRDAADLGRIFETTVDLSPFVAFAASSVRRHHGSYRLTGARVYLQPDTYFANSEAYQRDTLGHELLHIATRDLAGYFTTSWLEEGVAQVYGEVATPPDETLAQQVRAGTFRGRLPEAHEFFLGGSEQIRLSYQASASFVRYLLDRFGQDAPARFYARLGEQSPVSFGTGGYHLNRASRAVFGIAFDRLEQAWVRRLEQRY